MSLLVVREYTLKFSTYHGQAVCRIQTNSEESALYTPSEVQNILNLWRMGELKGSFGVGTILHLGATQYLE